METLATKVVPIGKKNAFLIWYLAIAGQIAWAVENSWFNTFMFDRLTRDPDPVAWMVGISAITATVTSIVIGTMSDRSKSKYGRRKPYIVIGYLFWGIVTIIYPMVEWIQVIGVAIVMAIALDAIMTFFGSMAYDASFNAWVTDIGHSSNRNRMRMFIDVATLFANILAIGLAGVVIDSYGYFVFFWVLGGYVSITALISAWLLDDPPLPPAEVPKTTFMDEMRELLDTKIFRENRTLFLLFINMALSGIAMQIYFPYLFIYLEHYIGMSKTDLSIYAAAVVFATMGILIVLGMISHRWNRKSVIITGTVIAAIFTIAMGLSGEYIKAHPEYIPLLFLTYLFLQAPAMMATIAHGGWMFDRYPEQSAGKFQGVRMIFMVAIPMIVGPGIGALTIEEYGIPFEDGYIPTPEIFLISGIITLLALIPIFRIPKKEGEIEFEEET